MSNGIVSRKVAVEKIDHRKTGSALRGQRKILRFSLRSVASEMGVSAVYLSDLERGNRPWNHDLANRFAAALLKLNT